METLMAEGAVESMAKKDLLSKVFSAVQKLDKSGKMLPEGVPLSAVKMQIMQLVQSDAFLKGIEGITYSDGLLTLGC